MTEEHLKDAEKMLKEAETKLEDIENILYADMAKNTKNALNTLQERLSFRWGLVTTHLEKIQKLEKDAVRARTSTGRLNLINLAIFVYLVILLAYIYHYQKGAQCFDSFETTT